MIKFKPKLFSLNKPKKLYTFYWHGMNQQRKNIKGEIFATSLRHAENNLIRQKIRVIHIKKKKQRLMNSKMSPKNIEFFFNKLAALLNSGLPILQAVEIIHKQQDNQCQKSITTTLINNIKSGNGLAAGLAYFPEYFSTTTYHLILAGEKTATLNTILEQISNHLRNIRKLRQKITQACLYPMVTFVFAICITITLLIIVVPHFTVIFQQMHVPIPRLTKIIISVSETLRQSLLPGILLTGILLFLNNYYKNSHVFQTVSNFCWRKLPLISDLLQKSLIIKFTHTLSTLLAARIPLAEALKITAPVFNKQNSHIIKRLHYQVTLGQPLHQAMENEPFFSSTIKKMIQAGETSGSLIKMLEKIAEFYESDLNHTTELISMLLEPLIMVILGALIGTLIIAMYLPIFKLGSAL